MDDDYSALQERLGTLPDRLSYDIMVGRVLCGGTLGSGGDAARGEQYVPFLRPGSGHWPPAEACVRAAAVGLVSLHTHTSCRNMGLFFFPFLPDLHGMITLW